MTTMTVIMRTMTVYDDGDDDHANYDDDRADDDDDDGDHGFLKGSWPAWAGTLGLHQVPNKKTNCKAKCPSV